MSFSGVSDRLVLSVPEAGALLGLSRNGAYAAAQRGDLPTVRMGKKLLVPKAALERLLADATTPRAAPRGAEPSTPVPTTARRPRRTR